MPKVRNVLKRPLWDADLGRMAAPLTTFARACALGLGVLLVAGCSSSGSKAPDVPRTITVHEKDFHISLSPDEVSAGTIELVDHNLGPDTHELIVVRANGRPLPLRPDGITLNEQALAPRRIGSIEGTSPGSVHTLILHLRPGRYVLFCNMLGHYLGGMRAELTVR
jgi:uncharacterized cupredoxin-like copper-binding protein